eukprot:487226-Amphidinium_carterae.1
MFDERFFVKTAVTRGCLDSYDRSSSMSLACSLSTESSIGLLRICCDFPGGTGSAVEQTVGEGMVRGWELLQSPEGAQAS